MTETWTPDIPVVTHDITDDVVLIEKNLDFLIHRFGYVVSNHNNQDQGAAGTSAYPTIKDIVDNLSGATNYAVVFFPHLMKDGATTKYTLDTDLDLSANTNVYFYFQPGAYLDQKDGGEILTIYSPDNIMSPKTNKMFDGDMIDFVVGGCVYLDWWGPDGTADEVELGYADNSLGANSGEIYLSTVTYDIADDITLSSNLTIVFQAGAILDITNAKTVTIQGNAVAPPMTVSSGAGTLIISSNIGASDTVNIGTLVAGTADIDAGTWQGTIDGAWTAAGQTCADLGTVTTADFTTADIDAGTFDGVVGGTTPAAGAFTTITGTSVDVTADVRGRGLLADGDPAAGVASVTTITNVTAAKDSNEPTLSELPTTAPAGDNAGWLKVWIGTSYFWIPYWASS